jgi:hypothetical protein
MGEAMATPIDNANHTSTKRAISLALRSVCMGELLQDCGLVKTPISKYGAFV